jgi:hypothetical protein
MDADEPPGQLVRANLAKLLDADRPTMPVLVDGLRLMKAFLKIELREDRQSVIDLATRLSRSGLEGGVQ